MKALMEMSVEAVARRPVGPKQLQRFTAQDLRKLQGFVGLPLRKLESLVDRMRVRQFARRSVIYKQGESEPSTYVLLSGIARLTCLNRRLRRNLLEVLGPGDVIEIPSLLPDIHHSLSCEAFTDCVIGLINPKELVERVVGIPFQEFGQALNLTVGRWWRLLERHSNLLNQTVRERVALALSDVSRKFGVQDDRGVIINLSLSHQDVADLVDCSRPKVSECIRRLAEEGVVIREQRRLIIDPAKIAAILRP